MPPRGGSTPTPSSGNGPAPTLPEFITNDLYGSLIATAIERGRQVLAEEARREGRQPSVSDQVGDQMVTRAVAQLRTYHGIGEPQEQPQ